MKTTLTLALLLLATTLKAQVPNQVPPCHGVTNTFTFSASLAAGPWSIAGAGCASYSLVVTGIVCDFMNIGNGAPFQAPPWTNCPTLTPHGPVHPIGPIPAQTSFSWMTNPPAGQNDVLGNPYTVLHWCSVYTTTDMSHWWPEYRLTNWVSAGGTSSGWYDTNGNFLQMTYTSPDWSTTNSLLRNPGVGMKFWKIVQE